VQKYMIPMLSLILLLCSATCFGNEQQVSVQKLITKYSDNNRYCRTQVTKSETLVGSYENQQDMRPGYDLYKTEFRKSNGRFDILENRISEFNDISHPELGRSQNMRRIWDGNSLYGNWFFEGSPENISLENPVIISHSPDSANKQFCIGYFGAPFEGVFTGDIEPLPVILAHASEVKVRENKEVVGGSECYVIDANGRDGK
jgi:hypothetical protein